MTTCFQQVQGMKIQTQSRPEFAKLGSLLEDMSVAMLTTVDTQGALVSRPMSPLEMDALGALWFFTDLRSAKIERLRAVNLSFSDSEKAIHVSLSGRGEIHAEHAHIAMLWTPYARPWFPDGPDSTNLALLKFIPETAEYWDAPSSKMIRMFAMAASIVAGKPIGLGDHDTLNALSDALVTTP